jgi:hypothetical protein
MTQCGPESHRAPKGWQVCPEHAHIWYLTEHHGMHMLILLRHIVPLTPCRHHVVKRHHFRTSMQHSMVTAAASLKQHQVVLCTVLLATARATKEELQNHRAELAWLLITHMPVKRHTRHAELPFQSANRTLCGMVYAVWGPTQGLQEGSNGEQPAIMRLKRECACYGSPDGARHLPCYLLL